MISTIVLADDHPVVREGLRGKRSNQLLQALVQKKRSDLKIEFNRELLARMGGSKA